MNAMIREYLGTLLRTLAAPVIAMLAATGYISTDEATSLVLAVIPIVISVVWGLVNKSAWRQTAKDALQHPATSSEKTLQDVIAGK